MLYIMVFLGGMLVYQFNRGSGRGIDKTCLYCRQTVHPLAVICPYCQSGLGSQQDVARNLADAQAKVAEMDRRAIRLAFFSIAIGFVVVFLLTRLSVRP